MKTNSIVITVMNSLGLAALLLAGIWLFPLREQSTSQNIAREVNIKAQAARQLVIQGQFLILVPKVPTDLQKILDGLGLEITMPMLNWVLLSKKGQEHRAISLDSPEANEDRLILSSLLEHPHILDAQHNYVLETALVPVNNKFSQEWQLQLSAPVNPAAMNMPAAWEITQGAKNTVVAIVDDFLTEKGLAFPERFSGCTDRLRFLHPYVSLGLGSKTNVGTIPHGEIMLLALGACNNLEPYSTGIDWNATLLAVQRPSLGQAQSFLAALFASGIDVCEQSTLPCPNTVVKQEMGPKANILLLPFSNNAPDILQFSSDMVNAISQKNILVVAAAGNNNEEASSFFPGATPGVINVGALNRRALRATFSNWGPSIDLLAPGDNIDFYYPSGRKRAQGTSLAAAYVAGALSLMVALDPDLNFARARYILSKSAYPMSCDDYCDNTPISPAEGSCSSLCCKGSPAVCGVLGLDIHQALKFTKDKIIKAPLLELRQNYFLLLRSYPSPQEVLVHNVGDVEAQVEAIVFDDSVIVSPQSFTLSARGSDSSFQTLQLSFRREPFTRTTQKIELVAKAQGKIVDTAEIYVEYIPKK